MLKAGAIIGERYEVVGKIGTGGMADVYKANDKKLNRNVAVKVLKPEFRDDTTFISKFKTEAQSAAKLTHPNIVNVFDVGDDDGMHYIVMELVEGITLKEYISKKGKLTVREATSIAIQVSMGLEAAHLHNIVHRDVKPQNIIISTDGKVKVTDFGIARAASSNTISSNVMGSVHYSSPEQVRGGYSDEKSDIYSLGITIYEMVTGRLPFDGETTVAIAIKHLQDEMEPPSRYASDIPFSLEQIIYKCTQKSVDRRYNNMTDVISDLKRSLVEPNGNFVTLIPASSSAQTVTISKNDLNLIHSGATGSLPVEARQAEEKKDKQYEEYEEEDGINSKLEKAITIGGFVIGAVIIFIIIYFIGQTVDLFKIGGSGGDTTQSANADGSVSGMVKVPKLIGYGVDQAVAMTNELSIGVKYIGEEPSTEYAKGVIIYQSVDAGTEVEKNTTIEYKTSSGPDEDAPRVPNVVGYSQSNAEQQIKSAGLITDVKSEYSDEVTLGNVISISPEPGTILNAGDKVTITVSRGADNAELVPVTVPNMRGESEESAKETLSSLGLIVDTKREYTASLDVGDVIAQSIAAGKKVYPGTTITITVNTEGASESDKSEDDDIKDTTESVSDSIDSQKWSCDVLLKEPNNYTGGEVRMILLQEVDGETKSTIIVEGEVIDFPYELKQDGAEGVEEGVVYLYELVKGNYIEKAVYKPIPFKVQ